MTGPKPGAADALFRLFTATHLKFAIRVATAGLVTWMLSGALHLPQSLWAVLTALIVMQASVGASLKAMFDRMTGSIGGAVWGGLIASLLPQPHGLASEGLALAVALAPLAYVAAVRPSWRVAPVTAAILILNARLSATGPLLSAVERILEVGLGSVAALIVSLTVFPTRGHSLLADTAAKSLKAISLLMEALAPAPSERLDQERLLDLHAALRKAVADTEAAAEAAARERANYLTGAPDPEPLCRTLRRLRHDLVMLGRAEEAPLPAAIGALLDGPMQRVWEALADHARMCASALESRTVAPSAQPLEDTLAALDAAVAGMRRERLAQGLETETVGRIFSLSFAFGQARRNLQDLNDRVNELAA